jgi:hypothetical protein
MRGVFFPTRCQVAAPALAYSGTAVALVPEGGLDAAR